MHDNYHDYNHAMINLIMNLIRNLIQLDVPDKSDEEVDNTLLEEDQYGKLTIVPANFQRITNKDSTIENKTYVVTR